MIPSFYTGETAAWGEGTCPGWYVRGWQRLWDRLPPTPGWETNRPALAAFQDGDPPASSAPWSPGVREANADCPTSRAKSQTVWGRGVWETLSWWEPCALGRALWSCARLGCGWAAGELEQQGPASPLGVALAQCLLGWLGLQRRDLGEALKRHRQPLSSWVG